MLIHLETLKNLRKYKMTTLVRKVDKLNITISMGKLELFSKNCLK